MQVHKRNIPWVFCPLKKQQMLYCQSYFGGMRCSQKGRVHEGGTTCRKWFYPVVHPQGSKVGGISLLLHNLAPKPKISKKLTLVSFFFRKWCVRALRNPYAAKGLTQTLTQPLRTRNFIFLTISDDYLAADLSRNRKIKIKPIPGHTHCCPDAPDTPNIQNHQNIICTRCFHGPRANFLQPFSQIPVEIDHVAP